MGQPSKRAARPLIRVLVAVTLVGGVALAQQGLIAEPWRQVPVPAAALIPPLPAMPDSGLGGAAAAVPVRPVEAPRPAAAAHPAVEAPKWSPPVVALLVDPWAKAQAPAPAPQPRWVPATSEIVDPWAARSRPEPRVASRRAEQGGSPRAPIF